MSTIAINSTPLGTSLQTVLMADNIEPGSTPSYELCKTIYLYHPLGAKIVETPILLAMSKPREITVSRGPESRMREAYNAEWEKLGVNKIIQQTMFLSRIYGQGSVGYLVKDAPFNKPIDPWSLWDRDIYFNLFDPLNTAGSLVLNQNPNAIDFMKNIEGISIMGERYHPSRTCVMFNESPMYLAYTTASFGYVGRSVYQRALFPLKSFIQTMTTDDMVSRKAGLLVAKIKQAGSILNKMMERAGAIKRSLLKEAQTEQVIQIDLEEEITAIDMQNIDASMTTARKNIIENIATSSGTPAKLLLQESFAEGFGEGTEDMRLIVQFIGKVREDMAPLYAFFDTIVQYRAWNPEFYASIQAEYPQQYASKEYRSAFLEWRNSFKASWPSLLEEPESELVKVDKEKLDGIKNILDSLLPSLDPLNKAKAIEWAMNNLNEMKERMFKHALDLDIEALEEYEPPEIEMQRDGQEFEQQQANKKPLQAVK